MNRPILKNRTVMKQFKNDGNLTLDRMAENYGMSLEEFIKNIKRVCGKENFADLQKLNNKRLKAGKGKPIIINPEEEDEEMKAIIREDLKKQKEALANNPNKTTKEDNSMDKEKNVEKMNERLKVLGTIISTVDGELMALNALQEATRAELAEHEEKINSLRLEEGERSIEIQEKQAELENAKAEQLRIQKEVDSLTKVLLLAPKYLGKLPNNRKIVSTVGRANDSEAIKVERVPKEEWFSQPSIEKMMASGYDSLEKYFEVFEFVQLVLKYQLEGKAYELRATDSVKEMIKAEGGEI